MRPPVVPGRVSLRRLTVVTALAASLAATGVSVQADAATTIPTGLRVVGATSSSFTVTVKPVARAKAYRVYASTVKGDVYVRNIHKKTSRRHSGTAKGTRITVARLPYTSAPYYYRVEALIGSGGRWSSTWPTVGLRPAAPSGLVASSGRAGTSLSWRSVATAGSVIEQATNRAFTTGRVNYRTTQSRPHFTPYAVATGHTYYFRVRGKNLSTVSWASPAIAVKIASRTQTIRVMTYNSLTSTFNGTREGNGIVGSWAKRLPGQIALIKSGAPDVLGIQEGAACVVKYKNKACARQIDSLIRNLGSAYRPADVDSHPTLSRYTGNYILYRPARLAPVGAGGHWATGSGHFASYQVFRTVATGAKFLFVTTHLVANQGAAYDRQRAATTNSMVSQAKAFARRAGVTSIVYSGDFNSYPHRYHFSDTTGAAMAAAGTSDAIQTAQVITNSRYNSINQYFRTPPRNSGSADHIYVSPGVGVEVWRELLRLSHGKFVGTIPSDHNPVDAFVTLPY